MKQAPPMEKTPEVWVVTAYRAGERAQVLALAEALGWPFKVKEVLHKPCAWRTNLLRGSDLSGTDLSASDALEAPWPDLLISAGMRNEPVCRWIREQSAGRCKIVHIGRPWAKLENFDLVVTTPQYRLPRRDNVLQNTTTLHRVTQARLQQAAADYKALFEALPGPCIAVIIGGNSGPFTLGKHAARRLAEHCNALAESRQASLLITTSSRTSAAAVKALQTAIKVPAYTYFWEKGKKDNPYYAFLAMADELVVTADSISMLTEACATGKPVHMFDPGVGKQAMRRHPLATGRNDFHLSGLSYRLMMALGPQRLSRDIRLVHDSLLAEGRAVWLGDNF
ncbi:MAG: mitochondrial fission ELM1 family protein, partial [Gammaproteobacteria bacterium]